MGGYAIPTEMVDWGAVWCKLIVELFVVNLREHGEQFGLLLYNEPTSYLHDFFRLAVQRSTTPLEIFFIIENGSQNWNISIVDLPAVFLPKNYFLAIHAIYSKLKSGRCKFLHLAGWGQPVLATAMLLGWLFRVPVFVESDTQIPFGLPLWKRALKRAVFFFLFRIPTIFLPAGSRQADFFRHYGIADENIVIGQMTVDVDRLIKQAESTTAVDRGKLRAQYSIRQEQELILYVGRLEPYKGISILLEAFAEVLEKFPNAVLLIVGDGSLRQMVQDKAKKIPAVCYPGRLEPDVVYRVQNIADIAVVPSLYEPWGLVVNEFMAAGLPVIATDRTGCVDDLVFDGKTGLVVSAGSRAGLVQALTELLLDPAKRAVMGSAGQQLISGWGMLQAVDIANNIWSGRGSE